MNTEIDHINQALIKSGFWKQKSKRTTPIFKSLIWTIRRLMTKHLQPLTRHCRLTLASRFRIYFGRSMEASDFRQWGLCTHTQRCRSTCEERWCRTAQSHDPSFDMTRNDAHEDLLIQAEEVVLNEELTRTTTGQDTAVRKKSPVKHEILFVKTPPFWKRQGDCTGVQVRCERAACKRVVDYGEGIAVRLLSTPSHDTQSGITSVVYKIVEQVMLGPAT